VIAGGEVPVSGPRIAFRLGGRTRWGTLLSPTMCADGSIGIVYSRGSAARAAPGQSFFVSGAAVAAAHQRSDANHPEALIRIRPPPPKRQSSRFRTERQEMMVLGDRNLPRFVGGATSRAPSRAQARPRPNSRSQCCGAMAATVLLPNDNARVVTQTISGPPAHPGGRISTRSSPAVGGLYWA